MTRLYMIVKEMKEIYYNFLFCVILRQEMKWHREVSFSHRLYCQWARQPCRRVTSVFFRRVLRLTTNLFTILWNLFRAEKKYYSIIVLRVIYLKKIARDPVDTNIYIYFFVSAKLCSVPHSNFHYLNYIRLLKIAVNKEEWNNHFNLQSWLCRNRFYL